MSEVTTQDEQPLPGPQHVVASIVSEMSSPMRVTVVTTGGSRGAIGATATVQPTDGDGMSDKIEKIEDRLGRLETDVAVIKERISHMPTTTDIQKMITSLQSKVIWGFVIVILGSVAKWTVEFVVTKFAH